MFPYTEKYKDSKADIQNNNSLYKNTPRMPKRFRHFVKFRTNKIKKIICLFYYMYNFHNSYFVIFVNFVYLAHFVNSVYTNGGHDLLAACLLLCLSVVGGQGGRRPATTRAGPKRITRVTSRCAFQRRAVDG